MPYVTQLVRSIQYTGANGSYIIGTWDTGATFLSDTGSVLTFRDGDSITRTVHVNDWVIQMDGVNDAYPQVVTPTNYAARWRELINGVTALSMGSAPVPALTASGSTNIAVDISPTMANTTYTPAATLVGTSALLADLEITSVTVTDADTITVSVTNNGILTLSGATVVVAGAEVS